MTKYGEWKIWNGGENPAPGKRVQVQWYDDSRSSAMRRGTQDADCLTWTYDSYDDVIIAYREVIEPVVETVSSVDWVAIKDKNLVAQVRHHFTLTDGIATGVTSELVK